MKRYVVLVTVVIVLLTGQAAAARNGCEGTYFQMPSGRIDLTRFDPACIWDTQTDKKLRVSGTCGIPQQHNHYQILGHDNWCDWITGCPKMGALVARDDIVGVLALKKGDAVGLCSEGVYYRGVVVGVRYMPSSENMPWEEFDCGSALCGTATTSSGPFWPTPEWWMGRVTAYLRFFRF